MHRRGSSSARDGAENAAPNDALFDESKWRLPVFRLMLPIGVLISIEQFAIAPTASASFAAGFAAALLFALWLMAWHPKISTSRWIAPVGDAFIILAAITGCIVDGLGVLVFHDRNAATAMQTLAFWVPIIALYLNLVLNRKRILLALCLTTLIVVFVAAHMYAQREWGMPILLATVTTFIGQIVITSGVTIIFSQYRSGMSSAVAQLRIAEAQSMTDSLTGLPNRRSFLHDAKTRWTSESVVALLVLDIDKFKTVNDTLGHHAGDQVLTAFAEAVQVWITGAPTSARGTPTGARMYRWGGEEFALSIAQQSDAALDIGAQLCAYVRGLVLPFGARITVSIGGTKFDPNESVDSAFQRADKALYQANSAGRDRAVFLAA